MELPYQAWVYAEDQYARSWAIISGVVGPLILATSIVILLLTVLTTTHELPSRAGFIKCYTTRL